MLRLILDKYYKMRTTEPFGGNRSIREPFEELQEAIESSNILFSTVQMKWSIGQGNWAKVPWIAFLDNRETTTTQSGIYVVYVFCEDMSGVYLALMQGVTDVVTQESRSRKQAREMLRNKSESLRSQFSELQTIGFNLDNDINLNTAANLGIDYEFGTIAYKYYKAGDVPEDKQMSKDLFNILHAYKRYIDAIDDQKGNETDFKDDIPLNQRVKDLIENIKSKGYTFEPWQIAAYITALRTKPFVILAGVSGTGKSKLPQLVAEATGGECRLLPVRPDWTDSSDVLGYCDLQGEFRPGPLLTWFNQASDDPQKHYVGIIDEMNLARVEHYFAEVLSQIENRQLDSEGSFSSGVLINQLLNEVDTVWTNQVIPGNFAMVGTVNMDESAYGFSRKVLDRAFTIEFSDINLSNWEATPETTDTVSRWPVEAWHPKAIRLNMVQDISSDERNKIKTVIQALEDVNKILIQAQLQVAYRTRDEISLFVLHADEVKDSFVTSSGDGVDPMDLAIQMKILPRIIGGSAPVRQVLLDLLGWAISNTRIEENDADIIIEDWIKLGRPASFGEGTYPRTAARLCLMWDRLNKEGFTSYWM
ncbi:5-methylcytosine-specific restriction related [hydrocarbon metagenome]|uniref:5-methylcytosine-specific restriction related n=1 Tax=hydrocarbon metagenome TaxID=938273 RepID=A0A0W8E3F5_9ZZZZ